MTAMAASSRPDRNWRAARVMSLAGEDRNDE